MSPRQRNAGLEFAIALAALGVVAVILVAAKHEKSELLEELDVARRAKEKALIDLDGALHELRENSRSSERSGNDSGSSRNIENSGNVPGAPGAPGTSAGSGAGA